MDFLRGRGSGQNRPQPQAGGQYQSIPDVHGDPRYQQQPRGRGGGSGEWGGSPYMGSPGGYGSGYGGGDKQGPQGVELTVVASPTDDDSRSNRVIVYPSDGFNEHLLLEVHRPGQRSSYAVTARAYRGGGEPPMQARQIALSKVQRQWMGLNPRDTVIVSSLMIDPRQITLASLTIFLGFMRPKNVVDEVFSVDDLAHFFHQNFDGMLCSTGQPYYFDFHGHAMKATVKDIQHIGAEKYGLLHSDTDITVTKSADSPHLKLKASARKPPPNAILAPNFRFEDVGIGGLDAEFAAIFRRAFASRMFPRGLVDKLGIQHVKGILLYGPPGTGKTLMARQIGKMLNAREPKIVNGPEILSKYVGASEENVRKLFADAEKEYKEKAEDSELHIIIFDELDAITKHRGSTNSGTGVGDTVVNQLLSKMDGVDQLNNILIIGMTNRRDMIDEALLRPGRLEVHVEISLPDEHGRLQILSIHTAKMAKEGVMDRDVNLAELATLTKNFSGAEIEGLVKSATSFAFQRHIKVGTTAGISNDLDSLRVKRNDFMLGLEEVQPAFGVSEEELQGLVQNGIIHYDESVENILQNARLLVEQVRTSTRTPLVSVLLHGLAGTGKTALAATIAQSSEYPFIKLVSPDKMVGFSEQQKVQAINKTFNDSYKSPLSVIVIDNIERLIDWVKIGSRFSNAVVQALMVLMGHRPPMGRRLLILATTSNRAMVEELEMAERFDAELYIPPITSLRALSTVLDEVQLLQDDRERNQVMSDIEVAFRPVTRDEMALYEETKLSIGVKKLLNLTEMARLDPDQVGGRFVSSLIEQSRGAATVPRATRRNLPPREEEDVSPGYYPGVM